MKKLLLVAISLSLGACVHTPLDAYPPAETVEIKQPSSVVYGSLAGYPSCVMMMRPEGIYMPHDGSFQIYYMYSLSVAAPAPIGLIKGRAVDESTTRLELYGLKGGRSPDLARFINRVKTGSCE